MHFRLHPLRFSFVAQEHIHFTPGSSTNILRGAFGTILRHSACKPRCTSVRDCEWRESCPYARMFEPSGICGPSGFADWPRPFVFRGGHLDGLTLNPGSAFYFDLNLFDVALSPIESLITAFAELASQGLGPHRGKANLEGVSQLDALGVPEVRLYEEGLSSPRSIEPLQLDLLPRANENISSVRVRFVTPTELKSGARIASKPEFGILAARVRDRISVLRELYGGGALPLDFRGFGCRAASVRMTRCDITNVTPTRRSSRTGQVHSLGGFIGEAEYQGELTEFVPFLKAAKWTGVGRQTVWGKGRLEIS